MSKLQKLLYATLLASMFSAVLSAQATGLEALVKMMGADKPLTRALQPAAFPSQEWVTAQVELSCRRKSQ